jgi:hypothetical protein
MACIFPFVVIRTDLEDFYQDWPQSEFDGRWLVSQDGSFYKLWQHLQKKARPDPFYIRFI